MPQSRRHLGFTLIELSIVLVIIGLIIGGVLVGRDLISAATVRSQISQIEKYNSAVNTFRGKYGYLPGDISDPTAQNFGFIPRGQYAGEGDGNGILEGNLYNGAGDNGYAYGLGETVVFWSDLSKANLVEGSFNTASSTANPPVNPVTPTSIPSLDAYFPKATIGAGGYVYIYSANGGSNYFGISGVGQIAFNWEMLGPNQGWPTSTFRVSEAYVIDQKIDDALPQSGRVTAKEVYGGVVQWLYVKNPGIALAGSSATCYDNGNNAAATMVYSMSQNKGAFLNCNLSFQFQ